MFEFTKESLLILGITALIATAVSLAINWFKSPRGQEAITEAIGAETFGIIMDLGRLAVNAVEQMAKSTWWDSEQKLAEASDFLYRKAKEYGINISAETIRWIIEANVGIMNNLTKK